MELVKRFDPHAPVPPEDPSRPVRPFMEGVAVFKEEARRETERRRQAAHERSGAVIPVVDDDDMNMRANLLAEFKDAQLGATGPRAPKPSGISDAEADAWAGSNSYGLEAIDVDERRELVEVANLPMGLGWGAEVQQLLSGGLGPGDVVALGAGLAGAGKTAFLLQLADGLAMRCVELASDPDKDRNQPLTPVLIVSELDQKDIAKRFIARLLKFPVNVLRSSKSATRNYGRMFRDEELARHLVQQAYQGTREAVQPGGWYDAIRPWQHVKRMSSSPTMLEQMEAHVERWKKKIREVHPQREIIPVVVLDPVQRWNPPGMSELEALNVLSEKVDEMADRHGWVVLMSSDTNKETAKQNPNDASSSAAAFRGTYKLIHSSETTIVLRRDDPVPSKNAPKGFRFRRAAIEPWQERPVAITISLDKNRNGPLGEASFAWRPACGSFTPEEREETEERRRTDQIALQGQMQAYEADTAATPMGARPTSAYGQPPLSRRVLDVLAAEADMAVAERRPVRGLAAEHVRDRAGSSKPSTERELRALEAAGTIVHVRRGNSYQGWALASATQAFGQRDVCDNV